MDWKKNIINFLKFVIFLGIGLGILYLVYQNQNAAYQAQCALDGVPASDCSLISKVINDFKGANYFWVMIVLIAFTVSNVSRAIRWNMLIHPLGYRPRFVNSFLSTVLGYFANLGLPRIGEVVRGGTLSRYEKIPLEKVMGTIVVDRIVDVISILLVTSLAFLLEFQTLWGFAQQYIPVDRLVQVMVILGILGVLGLGVLWLLRKALAKTKFYEKFMNILMGFYDGLKTIGQLEKPWLFVFHSINIWLMYYLMTYLCFFAFAPTAGLSPLAGLVVFVFGGWGIVIPSPGGMGTYHFLVQIALGIYGIGGDDAFSFANIAFFSIQLGCNVFIGLLALLLLPILNRSNEPKLEE
ncbi:MAG: flippase-like domain-containing protein [Saprospiraceae bacterium]|nr:flippase-like domain-containing protein [Saprospiraceae bacterium]